MASDDPIVVPIPIRPDLVVRPDISRKEAEKVARVVAALASKKRHD